MQFPSSYPSQPVCASDPSEKLRLTVKLENNERGFYSAMLSQADPEDSFKVKGKDAVLFFKRSGLSVEVLKNIWQMASFNGEYLGRDEFYVALRLIAYAQNNIEVSAQSIQANIKVPLPKFGPKEQTKLDPLQPSSAPSPNQKISLEEAMGNLLNQVPSYQKESIISQTSQIKQFDYSLPDQEFLQHQNLFQSLDVTKRGAISGDQAKQILLQTQVQKEHLIKLWYLCDSGSKGFLHKGEFIVALHLAQLLKRGAPLPATIPDVLRPVFDLKNDQRLEKDKLIPQNSAQFNQFDQNSGGKPASSTESNYGVKLEFEQEKTRTPNLLPTTESQTQNQSHLHSNATFPLQNPQLQPANTFSQLSAVQVQQNIGQQSQTIPSQITLNQPQDFKLDLFIKEMFNTVTQSQSNVLEKLTSYELEELSQTNKRKAQLQFLQESQKEALKQKEEHNFFLKKIITAYQTLNQKLDFENNTLAEQINAVNSYKMHVLEELRQLYQASANQMKAQIVSQNAVQHIATTYSPLTLPVQQQQVQHQNSPNLFSEQHLEFDVNQQFNAAQWNDFDNF